jgi:putative transposase
MPRAPRYLLGGYVYHVLNRAAGRLKLFRKAADYEAFLRVLDEALEHYPTRLLGYCLMPTHWHFVFWPERDGQLSQLLRWLTLTHAVRWHAHYHSTGSGHVYQNRFKAFPVAEDDHYYTVLRYAERNPLRARLVERAEAWRWSSLAARFAGASAPIRLHDGPLPLPADWLARVNAAETEAELAAVRTSVTRRRPFGAQPWVTTVAQALGLQAAVRGRSRPRKLAEEGREK